MAPKKSSLWKTLAVSLIVTAAVYGVGVLLVTLLTLRGVLGEERIFSALAVLALLTSLIGGLTAGQGKAGPRGSLANTGLFAGFLTLLCLGLWQKVTSQGCILLAALLLGGLAAAAIRGKVGKHPGRRLVKTHKKGKYS